VNNPDNNNYQTLEEFEEEKLKVLKSNKNFERTDERAVIHFNSLRNVLDIHISQTFNTSEISNNIAKKVGNEEGKMWEEVYYLPTFYHGDIFSIDFYIFPCKENEELKKEFYKYFNDKNHTTSLKYGTKIVLDGKPYKVNETFIANIIKRYAKCDENVELKD
jgi:hypothetical protein